MVDEKYIQKYDERETPRDSNQFIAKIKERQEIYSLIEPDSNTVSFELELLRDSKAILRLDKPTNFSSDIRELINKSRKKAYRLLSIFVISPYRDKVNAKLRDWEVTSVTPTEIEIRLDFTDPKDLSIGFDSDILFADVNLTELRNKEHFIAPRTILETPIPTQFASEAEIDIIDSMTEIQDAASKTNLATWLVQLLTGASL